MVAHIGRQNKNDWQSTYLGRGALPRDLSGFEIEAFFTYSEPERRIIDDERRTPRAQACLGATDWFFAHDRSSAGGFAHGAARVVASSGRAVRHRGTGPGLASHDLPAPTDPL